MNIGPMQLLFAGFEGDVLESGVIDEIFVATGDAVRLIDLLVVEKDADGNLWLSDLSDQSLDIELFYGTVLGKLIDLGADESVRSPWVDAEEDMAQFVVGLTPGQINDLVFSLPSGNTAVVALLEHVWAVDLHQAVLESGGVLLAQALIQPEALSSMDSEVAAAITQSVAASASDYQVEVDAGDE